VLLGASTPRGRAPSWTDPAPADRRAAHDRNLNRCSPTSASTDVAQFVFSGLIRFDDRGRADPDAAQSVRHWRTRHQCRWQDDHYHLRPDVRFSDGKPLRRRRLFTWQQVIEPRNTCVPLSVRPGPERNREGSTHRRRAVACAAAPFVSNFFRCGAQGAILPTSARRSPISTAIRSTTRRFGSGVHDRTLRDELRHRDGAHRIGSAESPAQRVTYRIIQRETLLVSLARTRSTSTSAHPNSNTATARAAGVATSAQPSSQFEIVAFNAAARRSPIFACAARCRRRSIGERCAHDYLDLTCPTGATCSRSWAYTRSRPTPYDPDKARAMLDAAAGSPVLTDPHQRRSPPRTRMSTVAGVMTRQNAEVSSSSSCGPSADMLVHNAQANLLFARSAPAGCWPAASTIWRSMRGRRTRSRRQQTAGSVPPAAWRELLRVADATRHAAGPPNRRTTARAQTTLCRRRARLGEVLPYHTMVWRQT